jgi:hypothetical protein
LKAPAIAALALASSLLVAVDARAQAQHPGAFAADRYTPAPPGDRFETVQGAGVSGEQLFRAALTFEDLVEPLIVRSTPKPAVADQLLLHAAIDVALWDRVLLSASVPFILVNATHAVASPLAPKSPISATDEPSVGDVEIGMRFRLFSTDSRSVEAALGGSFWSTTGRAEDFSGDPAARGMPYASVSGELSHGAYAAEIGPVFERSHEFVDAHLGPELRVGAAGAWIPADKGALQIGPEARLAVPLDGGTAVAKPHAALEIGGSARLRLGAFVVGVGGAGGALRAPGTPILRAMATLGYVPVGQSDVDHDGIPDTIDACPRVPGAENPDPEQHGCPADRDGDGIPDAEDACPDEPGIVSEDPKQRGCPVLVDRDHDGIPDRDDACPDRPGLASKDKRKNGCPPDRDGDGVPDVEDACPDTPGVDDADPKRRGCPADADGDGVPDAEDACPGVKGRPSADATKNGCPHDVELKPAELELLAPVFDPRSAQLGARGDAVLREAARVLIAHPEAGAVVVEGAPGIDARRAVVVASALAAHGVPRARVTAATVPELRALRVRLVKP